MIAILSDIHANLEALEAVLADIEQFNVEAIYCLGDLVGYGPDPIPCLQVALSWDLVLLGNFDAALRDIGGDLDRYGCAVPIMRNMMLRNQRELRQHPQGPELTVFLHQLSPHAQRYEQLFVHGSPRDPLNEWIFPEDIYSDKKMAVLMSGFEQLCFCGHSHLPGIFRASEPVAVAHRRWSFLRRREPVTPQWDFVTPDECDNTYPLTGEKLICNVGSVGQPRDGDPRAGYVLWSPEVIRFRRVEYDVETTIRKIQDGPDDDMFGDRLLSGR